MRCECCGKFLKIIGTNGKLRLAECHYTKNDRYYCNKKCYMSWTIQLLHWVPDTKYLH